MSREISKSERVERSDMLFFGRSLSCKMVTFSLQSFFCYS